jgi:hypothetical protein
MVKLPIVVDTSPQQDDEREGLEILSFKLHVMVSDDV